MVNRKVIFFVLLIVILAVLGFVYKDKIFKTQTSVIAIDYVDLSNIKAPSKVQQAQTFIVDIDVKWIGGGDGIAKVEVGMYDKATVQGWYPQGLTIFDVYKDRVTNCVSSETNVDTKQISFTDKNVHTRSFQITAPKTDPNIEYVIHAQAFERCWTPNLDTGASDHLVQPIDLTNAGFNEASCQDGIRNQDEANVDCGGVCSRQCEIGSYCNNNDDCVFDASCVNNLCTKKQQNLYCGDGICSAGIGESQANCQTDCGTVVPPPPPPPPPPKFLFGLTLLQFSIIAILIMAIFTMIIIKVKK